MVAAVEAADLGPYYMHVFEAMMYANPNPNWPMNIKLKLFRVRVRLG